VIIKNGAPSISRDEVVLFPFDDYSIPFQNGVRLQLIPNKAGIGRRRIVVGTSWSS